MVEMKMSRGVFIFENRFRYMPEVTNHKTHSSCMESVGTI